jgi:hypothetical protein
MDINRLIDTLMRLFGRKLIDVAMKKGIDYAASRGKPEAEMSEADRAQAAAGRDMANRTKQIRNATRRLF